MAANRLLGDRYHLENVIGNGNYGQVFEAVDKQKNQKVAIKALFPEVLKNPDLMKIVDMEIKILSQINHRYIIKILDYFTANGQFFMVYEFCERGDLKMAVDRKGRLSEIDALKIIYQISEALCELKRHHIIHRDIKPENIFLTGEICKLGDFGLCYLGDRVQLNASVGSLGFLAPETQSQLVYSSKADIYSLGICFYEMIHGDIPFTQEHIANLLEVKMKLKIERQQHINISDVGLNLMRRMMEPNEQQRIDCQEVRDMLKSMFPSYHPTASAVELKPASTGELTRLSAEKAVPAPPPRSLAQSKNTFSCVNILSNEMMPASSVNVAALSSLPYSQNANQPRMTSPQKPISSESFPSRPVPSLLANVSSQTFTQMGSPSKRINQDLLPRLQKAIETSRAIPRQNFIPSQNEPIKSDNLARTYSYVQPQQEQSRSLLSTQLQPTQSWAGFYSPAAQQPTYQPRQSTEHDMAVSNQYSAGTDSLNHRNSLSGIEKTISAPPQTNYSVPPPSHGPSIHYQPQNSQALIGSPSMPVYLPQEYDKRSRQSTQPAFQPQYRPQPSVDHQRSNSVVIQSFPQHNGISPNKNNISSLIDAYRIDARRPSTRQEIVGASFQGPQYPARQQPILSSSL
jgi:serine/threonine protein kinase